MYLTMVEINKLVGKRIKINPLLGRCKAMVYEHGDMFDVVNISWYHAGVDGPDLKLVSGCGATNWVALDTEFKIVEIL